MGQSIAANEQAAPTHEQGVAVAECRTDIPSQCAGVGGASGIQSRLIDGAMDRLCRDIVSVADVKKNVACSIDLNQGGRRARFEEARIRVDQELVGRARHARRKMAEHKVRHTVMRDQPTECG